ncbi:MAG TPA: hypothetical protein VD793_06510, partial [Gemmatimonadales bacterium]|nr:hypothetical protein [Gemmatimonadales bacterium]
MTRLHRVTHVWAALAAGAALGAWLVQPGLALALGALLGGVTSVVLGRSQWRAMVPGVVAAAGAVASLVTALGVGRVESNWASVREELLEEGRAGLDRTLGEAVSLARRLAESGLNAAAAEADRRYQVLEASLRPRAPEHGVALFDASGQPVAWAGRHRIRPRAGTAELVASISGFYAILSATRQAAGWTAVGQVLLAADSAVPDRERSVAEGFQRRTGTELVFFPSRGAPQLPGVFDYCLPECRPAVGEPDTLFSVQIVPPPQGTQKLRLLERGGSWVARLAMVLFAAVAVTCAGTARYAGLGGLAGLLILTPAGERLGVSDLFSPAPYFSPALGPASASAGALALVGALVMVLAAGLLGGERVGGRLRGLLAAGMAAAAPLAVRYLSAGITPPVEGTSLSLWMTWETALALTGAAILMSASVIGTTWPALNSPGAGRAIAGVAAALATAGILLWRPDRGFGSWYVLAWIPVAMCAVRPLRSPRAAVVIGVVSGAMAASFTWGAALRGRLSLAERDVDRLGAVADPIGAGLLEALGRAAAGTRGPLTAADLYRLWRESPLSRDDYPAVLAAWDSAGRLSARLDLASLDLPASLLQAIAGSARAGGQPLVESFPRVPGVHYVLAVPHVDGGVTTVGVGPLSRVF